MKALTKKQQTTLNFIKSLEERKETVKFQGDNKCNCLYSDGSVSMMDARESVIDSLVKKGFITKELIAEKLRHWVTYDIKSTNNSIGIK